MRRSRLTRLFAGSLSVLFSVAVLGTIFLYLAVELGGLAVALAVIALARIFGMKSRKTRIDSYVSKHDLLRRVFQGQPEVKIRIGQFAPYRHSQ